MSQTQQQAKLIPTFNEKHNAELFAAVRAKGADLGAFVATMGWVKADQTIARAATACINKLPLNNIPLEKELHWAFIIAAEKAAQFSPEAR